LIFILTTYDNRHTIDKYLASWGAKQASFIQPLSYELFFKQKQFQPGLYIFADIELLSEKQLQKATELKNIIHSLNGPTQCINHPLQSERRYKLLKRLHAKGDNHFNIFRFHENIDHIQFPVFLRIENDHLGKRSELIDNNKDLTKEIKRLEAEGNQSEAWLITEHCTTSDKEGVFRKYSSFLVNGQIIPRHLFFSHDWFQKYDDLTEEHLLKEELNYIQTNPHEKILKKVFDEARIEYGRIDYSMANKQIQVWEINTNPAILSFHSAKDQKRIEVHQTFYNNFSKSLKALHLTQPGSLSINYRGQSFNTQLLLVERRLKEHPLGYILYWIIRITRLTILKLRFLTLHPR